MQAPIVFAVASTVSIACLKIGKDFKRATMLLEVRSRETHLIGDISSS
jgi:hypothetical protein